MHVIKVNDVNEALPLGLRYLSKHGVFRSSRNGDVIESPEPVTTVFCNPVKRVLYSSLRDWNQVNCEVGHPYSQPEGRELWQIWKGKA